MSADRKGLGTRERMLDVAERQFAEKGYEGAHLESIAQEVGVRKTALYYYFDSKEALYIAVLEGMLSEFARTLRSVSDRELSIVEQAARLLDAMNDILAEHPTYSQILIRIFVDRIPIDNSSISPIIQQLIGDGLAFYANGVRKGVFRKLSARHVFQSVLGMAVFHYAGGPFSASVIGVDDVFTRSAVAWRREQFRKLLFEGILVDPAQQT
jgi:TetR/AcrR family transcriptional regulator